MQNLAATIQCSNPHCLAFNPIENKLCQRCRTPIVKRYLRGLKEGIDKYKKGESIGDRYLLKEHRIVLDTKPALAPEVTEEIPDEILPYLQLFSYRLHVPQIYGLLESEDDCPENPVWLLEYGTVPTDRCGELQYPELLPKLSDAWLEATDLRQLNWLWQIARLWQPLYSKSVASSLLEPTLLRANGPLIQLLELQDDGDRELEIFQLAELWSELAAKSSDNIKKFIKNISQKLTDKKITSSEELIEILERGIDKAASEQKYTYNIFTLTDSGPSRSHNEDSCYPPAGKQTKEKFQERSLAIVCDGIGGHASGEVASQLAIDSILENLKKLNLNGAETSSLEKILELEKFVCAANDAISDRNDSEQRQERQRMGTTLAMSLGLAHQMYLTYVGDSRIYWITSSGCYQVSVDDDLASREVQLGYAFYRDALQYPNAGALVQALGMESSVNLRPTVEKTIIDCDSVFLLCSDGLSDYDRVEQYWQDKVVPILEGKVNLAEAGQELLRIANGENGHDNVTIALVHCQINVNDKSNDRIESWSSIGNSKPNSDTIKAEVKGENKSSFFSVFKKPVWVLLTSSILVSAAGIFTYYQNPQFQKIIKDKLSPSSSIGTTTLIESKYSLGVGDAIEVNEEIDLDLLEEKNLEPGNSETVEKVTKNVPRGSILKVVGDNKEAAETELILQVCYLPNLGENPRVNLQEGELGSIEVEELEKKQLKNIPEPYLTAKCKENTAISNSLSKNHFRYNPSEPSKSLR